MGAMRETLDAVFKKGVFKPARRPNLPEGKKVKITVEPEPDRRKGDILELAAGVLEGLSGRELEEIRRIALERKDFFGERAS
jgi:predicted DNA-binding antitoxin AbrB/MazE fold protein